MWFIYSILILLFVLLFIIIKSSILNFGFWFITKEKVPNEKLVLPISISLIILLGLITLATLILSQYNLSIIKILPKIFLRLKYSTKDLGYILLAYIISIVIYLILQGYILKLINIPYSKIFNKFRYKVSKKENLLPDAQTELAELQEEMLPLTYWQYYVIGLFAFSILFFCTIILEFIGSSIGTIICNRWIK